MILDCGVYSRGVILYYNIDLGIWNLYFDCYLILDCGVRTGDSRLGLGDVDGSRCYIVRREVLFYRG